MNRNRGITLLIIVLAMSMLSISGCAEGSLTAIVDAGRALLFDTENVTVKAEAQFSLDGTPFKTIIASQIQSDYDSLRDVLMKTPREDGTQKESGYMIYVQGGEKISYDLYLNTLDTWRYFVPRNVIMRRSIAANNLISLTRGMVELAEGKLPSDTVRVDNGNWTINVKADEVPEAANAVLMLMLQSFGGYQSWIDYRMTDPDYGMDVDAYSTVTTGILYTTAKLRLDGLTMTAGLDEEGRLTALNGTAAINLFSCAGTEHVLEVAFSATVTDYGTSVLPENPIPMEKILAAKQENLKLTLTEVYGYTQEEADAFVFAIEDNRIVCYPPEHPQWKYVESNGDLFTPFLTDYECYSGEGIVRFFLDMIRENDWINPATEDSREAMLGWIELLQITPNDELLGYLQSDSVFTADLFIRSFCASCYGPEEGWPSVLTEWQNTVITEFQNRAVTTE